MKKYYSRRKFLIKTSEGVVGAALVSSFGFYIIPNNEITIYKDSEKGPASSGTTYELGVEGTSPRNPEELDSFLRAVSNLGAQFMICQFAPERSFPKNQIDADTWTWVGSEEGFHAFSIACRKYNLSYFANQEITNFSNENTFLDKSGNDILAHPDGTYRWDISGKVLKVASNDPEFRGVVYDEAEHGQMRRELNTNGEGDSSTGRIYPYFAVTDGMTLEQAYDAVYESAKAVASSYRELGLSPMTENVFPSMLFTFARAGFDIAVKSMKESIDPVFAAIAMGAARQYGREFCITPDMWGFDWTHGDHFPGHPPEELRASLLYAYWIGSTRIFVENIHGLVEKKSEGGVIRYELSDYGRVYQWFAKEYVPSHPRPYSFKDIRPEIAILRFDDSDWGQIDSRFTDNLYGAVNLQTTPETSAWFKIWNILTHGQVHEGSISYNSKKYNGLPHDFFCPVKGVVVYDHLAGNKEIEGLKLLFLTGVLISGKTMETVQNFVRKGGLCVCLASLMPSEYNGRLGLIPDGSGKWLFVKDFLSEEVHKIVAPFLGKPNEISYRTDKHRLVIRRGKDGNTISIYLHDDIVGDNDDISESERVW